MGRSDFAPRNTKSPVRGSPARICIARSESGARCSLPAFIRSAGTVQSLARRSNPDHRAPIVSPVRAAVKIVNSSARRNAALVPQGGHEARHDAVGRGVMMLNAGDLAARREQLVEVTSPTCRVIAGPMSADGRPAQDRFDSPARPIGGLRLFLPNGLQNLQDERGIDRVDGKVVYRCREGRKFPLAASRLIEGGDPLIAVFRVPPAGPVRLDELVSASLEGDRAGGGDPLADPRRLPLVDRIKSRHEPSGGPRRPVCGLSRG